MNRRINNRYCRHRLPLQCLDLPVLARLMLALTVFLIVLWRPSQGVAVEVSALYEIEIPVNSQQRDERRQAIRDGFALVLVKVSGKSDVNQLPEVVRLVQSAVNFVQQYRYTSRPGIVPNGPAQKILWISFDPAAVKKAMWTAGVQVWGKARPSTLLWIAMEDSGQRIIIDANSVGEIRPALEIYADNRGMPIFFPLMDLQDQASLKFADVWGNFRSNIEKASERYQTEALLVARVLRIDENFWDSYWTLYQGDKVTSWVARGPLNDMLSAGVNSSADILASRFAEQIGTGLNVARLKVLGINNLNAYGTVNRYLKSLGPVKGVNAVYVVGNSVIFNIGLRTDQASLVQALALSSGKSLVPVETSPVTVPVTSAIPSGSRRAMGRTGVEKLSATARDDLVYRLIR
ncbi:MAG: DUF2066 domain-containing protein [Gammaproteobacteria bacterium]|nr:MAG: DUF2066 domain-containing protein [Gammaproteobacteria bacterium]